MALTPLTLTANAAAFLQVAGAFDVDTSTGPLMRLAVRLAALLLVTTPVIASAQIQTVFTTMRTDIQSGNPGANFGGTSSLYAVHTAGFNYFPLLQYDLGSFAGRTVSSNGLFSIFLSNSWGGDASTQPFRLVTIAAPWSQNSVTYTSFQATNSFGVPISTQTMVYNGVAGSYQQFVIPQSVLQTWINTAATNYGFAMDDLGSLGNGAASGHPDLVFEDSQTHPASLTFTLAAVTTAAPEPASLVLVATGLLAVAGLGARRRRCAPQASTARG